MKFSGDRLHLHIDNVSRLGDVFDITPQRLADAMARHPEVAPCLEVTVSRDGYGFDEGVRTAHALFGWNFERGGLAERAPDLRLVQVQGTGINHLLPFDWLPTSVTLANCRGAHGSRASEYLIMSVLALNNSIPAMARNQRASLWEQVHNSTIRGKTLLIYGVGHVGGDTAAAAQFFGLHVIGVRRTGTPHANVDEMHRPEDLQTLLPRADFIVLTAPHTPATERLFGAQEFALMKPGAGFVLYSRSKLVDYEALCRALEAGRISAIVDVFDEEPLPASSPLWQTPNLLVTPHASSNDPVHHAPRSLDLLFENLGRMLQGKELHNIVDLEQLY